MYNVLPVYLKRLMPRQATPLTDTKIKALRPRSARYRISDTGGLLLEVMPSGSKVWRFRYQLHGVRHAALTIGCYPEISLLIARKQRDEWASLVANGHSPKNAVAAMKAEKLNTIQPFAEMWMCEQMADKSDSYTKNVERVLRKDIFPMMGRTPLRDLTPSDVMALCDRIKSRGSPKMALFSRNVLKRMYDFAIARQLAISNPAAALVARFIATEESRTRVLSPSEIGLVMRAVYASDIRRPLKLALHLLMITMVRKTELTEATWAEFDLVQGVWDVPAERMKMDKPHRIYLSLQAVELIYELQQLAGRSKFLFPTSRGDLDQPISKSTLNQAVRALSLEIQHFVLHDFRRTASTHLHEQGYSSDAIEMALAHKLTGIKGVYNRAEYADQRRVILQTWADFVQAQLATSNVVMLPRAA
jgi:integrase